MLLPLGTIAEARVESEGLTAPFLKRILAQVPLVDRLRGIIHESGLLSLGELTQKLWGNLTEETRRATVLLLRMAAAARKTPGESPLIPHRLHVLFRAPQGLSACLDVQCTGPSHLRAGGLGCLQEIADRCRFCRSITLPVHRCRACGEWALAGREDLDTGAIEPGYLARAGELRYYLVADCKGKNLQAVTVDPVTGKCFGSLSGTRLFRASCPEHGSACNDPSDCVRQECPHCGTLWGGQEVDDGSDDRSRRIQPLRGGEHLAVGVAAETVLYGMPEYPDSSRDWKPGSGRRLLCFSDSRREAARLGPLLTARHETWVVRAAIANALIQYSLPTEGRLRAELARSEAQADDGSQSKGDRNDARRNSERIRGQLERLRDGISFQEFAVSLSNESRLAEILDSELGEKHDEWRQERWKENRKSVQGRAEALIGQELDNPLRAAVSLEAIGLLELVYPGVGVRAFPPS